ncbi:MAG: methyltransferase, partial [Phycicoccus sp.]
MSTHTDRGLHALALPARAERAPRRLPPVLADLRVDSASPESTAALYAALPPARMTELATRLLGATLAGFGPDHVDALASPRYTRWLAESDRVLQDATLVSVVDGRRTARELPDLEELWAQWEAERDSWAPTPTRRATVDLVEACLRAMPDVLRGRVEATDILFPGSSLARVDALYRGGPIADEFNRRVGEVAAAAVQRWGGRGVRILEVGAGTGATSSAVLAALEPISDRIEDYRFTDLSRAFLFQADATLRPGHPFLTTGLFDLERPGEEQGIEIGHFDLVIATNVLHATADIAATLANVKAAMADGGLLVLNEMSRNTVLAHVTFGLLDGWWRYRDAGLRIPGSPVLRPDRWLDALDDAGFRASVQPDPGSHDLGQQLTVAESDGMIRRVTGVPDRPAPVPAATAPAPTPSADAVPVPAMAGTPALVTPAGVPTAAAHPAAELRERAARYFADLAAGALRMAAPDLDRRRDLHEYGLDSILVAGMNNAVARDFSEVSGTLFFDLPTIDELADHFVDTRAAELGALFGTSVPAGPGSAPEPGLSEVIPERPTARPRETGRPLSLAQQGLWAMQRSTPAASAYNVPLCFRVRDLDVDALRRAFDHVRARHRLLTSVVRVEDGAPRFVPGHVE